MFNAWLIFILKLQDVRSILVFDEGAQKIVCPTKDSGAGVVIANFLPRLVLSAPPNLLTLNDFLFVRVLGHTDDGYAFHLANKYHDDERLDYKYRSQIIYQYNIQGIHSSETL